jgi:8-oxo-dGTP pyrophosphatase MutT (NUDIX family)
MPPSWQLRLVAWQAGDMTDEEGYTRTAARAILIDQKERVLLIWGCDPAKPEDGSWWYTPGGGVEPGESFAEALRRELQEEIGLDVNHVGEVIFEATSRFDYDGRQFHQRNLFFDVRVPEFEADLSALSAEERKGILSVHWLTVDEMRSTPHFIHPPTLPDIVASLLASDGVT